MPKFLAPNAITVIGVSAILFGILLIEFFIPDLTSAGPPFIYFFGAFAVIFYQTMDNIDGKQARKTGSSSPLGELFDHGVDSLNCCWCGLLETGLMGLGSSRVGTLTTFCTCFAMYLSTWETFHTHVLYLGFFNGPTEGLIMAALMMVVSGIWGPQVWNDRIIDLGSYGSIINTIFGLHLISDDPKLKDLWEMSLYISILAIHAPFCVYNVYKAKKIHKDEGSWINALYQLVPLVVITASVIIWTASPYSIILRDNHLALFGIACSLIFGRITTAIILAHLTKQAFPFWSLPMVPLVTGALVFGLFPQLDLIYLSQGTELAYLWAMLAFSFIYFAAYAYLIVESLCKFLDIRCFTIKPKHL